MHWFVQKGLLFRPVSAPGWIIFIATFAWLLYAFFDIDSHSHSASDTLINWSFQWIVTGFLYSAVAWFTSEKNDK